MIVDKKIMELIDSVFENQIRPIQKALLATEIQLYTNNVIEEQSQGQELPIQGVSNSVFCDKCGQRLCEEELKDDMCFVCEEPI